MTGSDIIPNFDQQSPRDQIVEVLTRLRSGVSLLDCSRHLVPIDRETVGKISDYADLLRDLIMAGAGTTTQQIEHAKPVPVPLCEKCPHDMFVRATNANFGYCMNLQRFVVESSDCEREGICTEENASAT